MAKVVKIDGNVLGFSEKNWNLIDSNTNVKRAIVSLTSQQEKAKSISSQENQLHLQAIRNLETLTKRTDEVRNATSRVTDITTSYAHALETRDGQMKPPGQS